MQVAQRPVGSARMLAGPERRSDYNPVTPRSGCLQRLQVLERSDAPMKPLFVFAGWLVALFTIAPCAGAEGKRPNILFLFTDDHAAHAMSCYGSKINQTPNL